MDTLAVGAVMAVFGWQPGTERHRGRRAVHRGVLRQFQQFLQPPRHPKWKEVNLAAQVPGWTRFPPAQDWLARQRRPRATGNSASFNAFLTNARSAPAICRPRSATRCSSSFLPGKSSAAGAPVRGPALICLQGPLQAAGSDHEPSRAATLRNRCRAASRFSTISAAITSGGGRLSASSRLSSFSQKMSRLSLSRCSSSS